MIHPGPLAGKAIPIHSDSGIPLNQGETYLYVCGDGIIHANDIETEFAKCAEAVGNADLGLRLLAGAKRGRRQEEP